MEMAGGVFILAKGVNQMPNNVTPEQIARAKEVNILDYVLSHEPNNVKRIGNTHYLKDHDSFRISNGLWKWESHGIGGKNVIDYLIKVRGYEFVDAVRHLAGEDYSATIPRSPPNSKPPPERKVFSMPPRNRDNERVIAYLQSRGIDRDVIHDCINRGALYESPTWHNCCFVGRDEHGKAKFAALRGTLGNFKRDADGSDKRFGFCLPPKNLPCNTLIVFESPIDLLSFDTLCKLGFIEPVNGWRLALGGTSMVALTQFIESRMFSNPIANCVVCTDRDTAGDLAYSEISEKINIKVSRLIPVGKDWNETLQKIRNEVNPLEDVRKDILFLEEPFKYPEAFRIKDGDNVKVTYAYDGEIAIQKCRHIDEAHLYIGNNAYHISELAEKLIKNGNKVEPIRGQKPMLDVLAGKYGEDLQGVSVPMTEAALKKLVGGKYETELLYVDGQGINGRYGPQAHSVILRGKDGIAVCGVGGENNTPTSLHPYWAQTYKRKLSPVERPEPKTETLLGEVAEAKTQVAGRAADHAAPNKTTEAR
jgi:hypothetical protein